MSWREVVRQTPCFVPPQSLSVDQLFEERIPLPTSLKPRTPKAMLPRTGPKHHQTTLPVTARSRPTKHPGAGLLWQRRPPRDSSDACSHLCIVGDPWEPQAQLDSDRQLSLLIEHITDRGGISLGND